MYYTPGTAKKRDQAPANWQVVIHTPTCLAPQGKLEEANQENAIETPLHLTVSGDAHNVDNLHGGGDDEELAVQIGNEFIGGADDEELDVIIEEESDEGEFISENEGSSSDSD